MEQYEFTGTNPISPHLVSRKAGVQCVLKSDVVEHTIDGTKYNLKEILDADIKGDKVTVKIGDEEKSVQEVLKDGIPETSVNKKYLKENYVERTEFDDKFENAVTTGDLELQNYATTEDVESKLSDITTITIIGNQSTARDAISRMKSWGYSFVNGFCQNINGMYDSNLTDDENITMYGTSNSTKSSFCQIDENANAIRSGGSLSTNTLIYLSRTSASLRITNNNNVYTIRFSK